MVKLSTHQKAIKINGYLNDIKRYGVKYKL